MSNFFSGFSNNYTGNAVAGGGYSGHISGTGQQAGTQGQGGRNEVDVTQLKAGDAFKGEIASVNGEDVQIQLANGQFMLAKLARDVQVAIGQTMTLQVQSNKDNHVVLKPVYDSSTQLLRVGEAALKAAGMAVNEKNLNMVSSLIENGMSIDKNTLASYNRLSIQNPGVEMSNVVHLSKLHLPVTEENARQLESYENMEHKLLDGIDEAADELAKVYEDIVGRESQGGAALASGDKFMERVLTILSGGDEGEAQEAQGTENTGMEVNVRGDNTGENVSIIDVQGKEAQQLGGAEKSGEAVNTGNTSANADSASANADASALENASSAEQEGAPDTSIKSETLTKDISITAQNTKPEFEVPQEAKTETVERTEIEVARQQGSASELLSQLDGEELKNIPDRVIEYMESKSLDAADVRQFMFNTDIGKSLTPEQRDRIFASEPFKRMIKDSLQKQWTITPEDIAKDGKVEELYQRILRESSQLSKLMNEALQSGTDTAAPQSKAMGNIAENVEFINQINQMFTYVKLTI